MNLSSINFTGFDGSYASFVSSYYSFQNTTTCFLDSIGILGPTSLRPVYIYLVQSGNYLRPSFIESP